MSAADAGRSGGITLIVEPSHTGHRFPYVAYVVDNLPADTQPVLLTALGARERSEFRYHLAERDIEVVEQFESWTPGTAEIAQAVARICRDRRVSTVLLMDADVALKQWWLLGWKHLRRLPNRPVVSLLLTRYPKPSVRNAKALTYYVSKTALVLLGMLTGGFTRVSALTSRDDCRRGLLVSRIRDPAFNLAHASDREQLRAEFGLPQDRRIVGVFGRISADKNPVLVAEAARRAGPDIDVLLAGPVDPDIAAWHDALEADDRDRVLVRAGFLDDREMDGLLAACDIVAVTMNYDRPSAVMGKALAAGVPVISAGSRTRAGELMATQGGVAADLTAASISAAIRRLLDAPPGSDQPGRVTIPTPRHLTITLTGREPGSTLPAQRLLGRPRN